MNIGSINLATGEELDEENPLEVKTINKFYADMWEIGIPPEYLGQIHLQMLLTETKYAEFAILIDGRNFKVLPVTFTQDLADQIIEQSKSIWYDRILPARKIVEEVNLGAVSQEELIGLVAQYEPEPDGSESYKSFMNERFVGQATAIEGDVEGMDAALQYDGYKEIMKHIKQRQTLCSNILRAKMTSNEEMLFGEAGKVTWKMRGKSRTMNVRVKQTDESQRVFEQIADSTDLTNFKL
jgi:predicted phage-related endonuclease